MAVAPALMLVAAAVSAAGQVKKANAAAAAAKYNGQIASQNAMIATEQGEAAAEAQQRDAERRIGQGVAAYGASGVDVGSGSPADVLADSARMAMLDNMTIKYNASLRAAGYKDQSLLENANASNATTSGYLAAGGTLISAYGQYYGMTHPSPSTGAGGQTFGG